MSTPVSGSRARHIWKEALMLASHRRARVAIVTGLLATAMVVQGGIALAGGYPVGKYRAVVSPQAVAAGTTTTFKVTLRSPGVPDASGPSALGSVEITPPLGIIIVSATAARGLTPLPTLVYDNTVRVNNLGLKANSRTAVVWIKAWIRCRAPGPGTWTTVGHDTQYFTDGYAQTVPLAPTSHLMTVASACRLAFVAAAQPAEAQNGVNISTQAGDPSGPPVLVQLLNANGYKTSVAGVMISLDIVAGTGMSGAALSGSTSRPTDASGRASFGDLSIDLAGIAYQLVATGTALVSATSDGFDIDDVLVQCSGPCSATDEKGNTTASVQAGTGPGGLLGLSLGVEALSCNDAVNQFYPRTSQVLTFDVVNSTTTQVVTITIDASSVTKPFDQYQACFSSPTNGFVNRFGVAISPGAAGLLPDCDNGPGYPDSPPPCVQLRDADYDGNVFVTFVTAEDDPKGHI